MVCFEMPNSSLPIIPHYAFHAIPVPSQVLADSFFLKQRHSEPQFPLLRCHCVKMRRTMVTLINNYENPEKSTYYRHCYLLELKSPISKRRFDSLKMPDLVNSVWC
jgi:hypothetical protein